MHDLHHPVRDRDDPREPQESADPRRWKALAAVSLAQFMLILDLTVVNVALSDLGADLDLSRTALTWAVSAYVLFFGGLLLLGGRFADVFGARHMMLTGLVIFIIASLASGLAQNETLLIGGRIGQGVGAALLSPAALSAITTGFHGEERNKALSVWASLGGVGFAAGVLIGGILTSGPGWRWVFFINVPVGVVLLAAIRAVVPLRRPDRAAGRIDVLGAVTVTAATGSLIYGMINAGDEGWADLETLLPIAAAIVLYGVFVVVERTVRNPLMHPSLLSVRPIVTGAFLMFIASGVLIADLFLGSQYLQHLRGLSALETGVFFLPAALGLMIGAIAAGRLVGTIGTRPVAVVGLVLVAIGNGLLIGLSADGNVYVEALPGTFLFALGGRPAVRLRDHLCPRPRRSARGGAGIGRRQHVQPAWCRHLCRGGLHRRRRGSHPHTLDRRVHQRLHRVHRRRRRGGGALATPCTVRNATADRLMPPRFARPRPPRAGTQSPRQPTQTPKRSCQASTEQNPSTLGPDHEMSEPIGLAARRLTLGTMCVTRVPEWWWRRTGALAALVG